ncbi:cache domain-containing sensor histidine kinase [Cohnella silvisoli]|uniref:histidine kinase n=1 Tax=Cohnella silvisoli TaxID=2873699 RepID=A0ABV1L2T6_9BACL|nr:sensor histidine kinase [Cohnella silvisoli]MCD9025856.1 sensor histidine kinase [Cohnella silvisoli]
MIVSFFRNMRFGRKLIISYLIIAIIPLCVLGAYAYNNAVHSQRNQLSSNMLNMAERIATEFQYRLDRQINPIKSIVYNPNVIQAVQTSEFSYEQLNQVNDFLEPFIRNYIYYGNDIKKMVIYSEYSKEAFGDYILPAARVSKEYWYLQTRTTTGTQFWYEHENEILFATHEIYDVFKSKPIGVLYVRLNSEKIIEEVLKQDLAGNGFLMISDGKHPLFYVGSESNPEVPESAAPNEVRLALINGKRHMLTQLPLRNTQWTLHYGVSTENIEKSTRSILGVTLFVILICFAVITLFAALFFRTLVSGLKKLYNKMNLVEKTQDFTHVISSRSKDEVGQLTNRFGQLISQINNLIAEVYERRIAQKEAEFKALQAQIHPHFLYNTLSVINAKAIQGDLPEISDLVQHLSNFYRTSLNNGKNTIVIRDELMNAKAYIEIQLSRRQRSFTVDYYINEELVHYHTINLTIQPIVENAIEHGLDMKREGNGHLRLSLYEENDILVFAVEDNGPGIPNDKLENVLSEQSNGFGLQNVHNRIRSFFGEPYGVNITNHDQKGTTVTLRIPKAILISNN